MVKQRLSQERIGLGGSKLHNAVFGLISHCFNTVEKNFVYAPRNETLVVIRLEDGSFGAENEEGDVDMGAC